MEGLPIGLRTIVSYNKTQTKSFTTSFNVRTSHIILVIVVDQDIDIKILIPLVCKKGNEQF